MLRYPVGLTLALMAIPSSGNASSFSFGAVVRAGHMVNLNIMELGLGSSTAAPAEWANAFFVDGQDTPFTLSWDGDTNTATWTSSWSTLSDSGVSAVSWNPVGGDSFTPGLLKTWTIAPGGLAVFAESKPLATSIQVSTGSLTGVGLSVLQPFSPASFTASQNGGAGASDGNPAAVTFTTSGSGSWTLSGTIRFSGLNYWNVGGAVNDQLRMAFDITGAQDSPEPATLLLIGLGLAAFAVLRSRKRWWAKHHRQSQSRPPE